MCEEYCAIHRVSGRCLVLIRFGLGCGFGGIVVEVLEVAVWWCVPSESILGARFAIMTLRLFWHVAVWIRWRSVVLWVEAVLSVLWMCLCVCFLHLLSSSRVRGNGALRVVCCRMPRFVISCSLMLCMWWWMVVGMWRRCQSACFTDLTK